MSRADSAPLLILAAVLGVFLVLLALNSRHATRVRAELARWNWGVILAWLACVVVGIGSVVSLLRWMTL